MVRAGVLRKRVEVQKYTSGRGADGSNINVFVTENTMWANVNPISAQERQQGDQTKAVRTHRVTMKFYAPGITAAARLKMGTRIFNIVSIIDIGERGCFTVFDVKEAEVEDV